MERINAAGTIGQPRPDGHGAGAAALGSLCLRAVVLSGLLGVLLGWWCRWATDTHPSTSAVGALAELGAPWIASAFIAGATCVAGSQAPRRWWPLAGATAGSTALVAATIVYYGPARTGTLAVDGKGSATVTWTLGSILVGGIFGAGAALWAAAPRSRPAAMAVAGLGTALASEPLFHLRAGDAVAAPPARMVLLGLIATGLAVPFALLPLRRAATAALFVVVLVGPVSLLAEIFDGALAALRDHLRPWISS